MESRTVPSRVEKRKLVKKKHRMRTIMVYSVIVIISVLLQALVLLYINNYYLGERAAFKVNSVINYKASSVNSISNFKIPDKAEDIKVSGDMKYLSYYYEGNIIVIELSTNKNYKLTFEASGKLKYYNWDSFDSIVYGEERSYSGVSNIRFYRYNFISKVNEEIINKENERSLIIEEKNSNMKIEDVGINVDNYIFAKVELESGQVIYTNFNTEISKYRVDKVKMFSKSSALIFQTSDSNKIKVLDKDTSSVKIDNAELIGLDVNDNIYIGKKENDKINKIYVGNKETNINEWTSINLKEPTDLEDIFITENGKIFIYDKNNNIIININSNKEYKFEGELIKVTDDGIVSIQDNNIKNVNFR